MSSVAARIMKGPIEELITGKLINAVKPLHLVITNESYKHNVPKGSESHFHVLVVSEEFNTINMIKRHRLVNSVLKEELASSIHALSISAKTPSEWEKIATEYNDKLTNTPNCMGGEK